MPPNETDENFDNDNSFIRLVASIVNDSTPPIRETAINNPEGGRGEHPYSPRSFQ